MVKALLSSEFASLLWHDAWEAMQEAHRMSERVRPQIEALLRDDAFRVQYQDKMLGRILEATIQNTGASMGNIQVLEAGSVKKLSIHVERGFSARFLDFFRTVERGECACGEALRTAQRTIVEDTTKSAIFWDGATLEALLDARVRAVQSTPITGSHGQVLGVLSTHYEKPREFGRAELRVIDYFARSAVSLLESLSARREARPPRFGLIPTARERADWRGVPSNTL